LGGNSTQALSVAPWRRPRGPLGGKGGHGPRLRKTAVDLTSALEHCCLVKQTEGTESIATRVCFVSIKPLVETMTIYEDSLNCNPYLLS